MSNRSHQIERWTIRKKQKQKNNHSFHFALKIKIFECLNFLARSISILDLFSHTISSSFRSYSLVGFARHLLSLSFCQLALLIPKANFQQLTHSFYAVPVMYTFVLPLFKIISLKSCRSYSLYNDRYRSSYECPS